MPWLKSEGKMPQNEKVWELSDAAYRLMDAGRHYAVQNMTDGHVPISRISALTPKPATKLVIHEVVKARLWHQLPDICVSCTQQRKDHGAGALPKTGYLVHDFLIYNPSKAEYEASQRQRHVAGKVGAQARWTRQGDGGPHGESDREPHGEPHNGSHGEPHAKRAQSHSDSLSGSPGEMLAPYPVSRTPVPVATATRTPGADETEPEIPGTDTRGPAGTAAKAAGGTRGGPKDAPIRHISDALRRATS